MQVEKSTWGRSPLCRGRPRIEREAWEFPGCRPTTIRREEIDTGDDRFEFRDAEIGTAKRTQRSVSTDCRTTHRIKSARTTPRSVP